MLDNANLAVKVNYAKLHEPLLMKWWLKLNQSIEAIKVIPEHRELMLLCCFLAPAELRGRVPLGGEPDEDAHSSSQRCGDPDGSGPVSQNQQELRWNPLAQDLHAHLWEWDLTPASAVSAMLRILSNRGG